MVRRLTGVLHYLIVLIVRRPDTEIDAVRLSTRRLLRSVDDLTDAQAGEPSLLPGWNRAEVLTHLARNADGTRRVAEAAARGEVGDQYPGGAAEREADIAAGRDRRASEVVADLRRSVDLMIDAWLHLPDDAWEREARTFGRTRTIRETVSARLREVEVHHVDLDLAYGPSDWPVAFVSRALDDAMNTLPQRAVPRRQVLEGRYRIDATDHGCAWVVVLHGNDVDVAPASSSSAAAAAAELVSDGIVTGWGCDLLAWLYGRRPSEGTLTASGDDVRALRLPTCFPYP
jgi:uncharacterized protein (TIGR03083 family)